jgi:hypothetical protein
MVKLSLTLGKATISDDAGHAQTGSDAAFGPPISGTPGKRDKTASTRPIAVIETV